MSTTPSAPVYPTRQQLDELDALLQRMLDLPVNQAEEEAANQAVEEPLPHVRATAPPVTSRAPEPAVEPQPLSYPAYMVVETACPAPLPPREANRGRQPPAERRPALEPPSPTPRSYTASPPGDETDVKKPIPPNPPPEEDQWVPLRSSWQPSAHSWQPLAETWQQVQRAAAPATPGAPRPASGRVEAPAPVRTTGDPEGTPASELASAESSAPDPSVEPPHGWLAPLVWFNRAFDAGLTPLGPLGGFLRGPSGRAVLGSLGLLCLVAAVLLAVAGEIGWTW